VRLADQLIARLQAQRQRGPSGYPIPFQRLVELADPHADADLAGRAAASKQFTGRAILALKNHPVSPVVLAEDKEILVHSEELLRLVLEVGQTPRDQGLPISKLKAALATPLKTPFAKAVERQVEAGTLPAGVAAIRIGGKPYLFLRAILGPGTGMSAVPSPDPVAPPPLPPRPAAEVGPDFEPAFTAVFTSIDRRHGSNNLVSLVELRRELSVPREVFDAGLRQLRVVGLYSLSAAEGRHGISVEEREAGIVEQGTLLLYVSRLRP
jgi:hypothetical protein